MSARTDLLDMLREKVRAPIEEHSGDIVDSFAGDKEIHAGDTVELEIEKIGVLRNKVVGSKAAWPSFTPDKPTGPLVKENR